MKITFIRRLLLTVIAFLVTVSANAQVSPRVQGLVDFYDSILGLESLDFAEYYIPDNVNVRARSRSQSLHPLAPNVYNRPTAFTAPGVGRTRFYVFSPSEGNRLLSPRLHNTDRAHIARGFATNEENTEQIADNVARVGFLETDLQARRIAAIAVAAKQVEDAAIAAAAAQVAARVAARERAAAERAAAEAPPADDGGNTGAGALAAVVIVAAITYSIKRKKPDAPFTFTAMPIDTDAYTAQFNFAPRENWNINLEYTEGNLFASHDTVKPDTNATAKMTVKWTW